MQVLSALTKHLFSPFAVKPGEHISPVKRYLMHHYSCAVFHQPKPRHHHELPGAWPKGTYRHLGMEYEWVYVEPPGAPSTWKTPVLFITGCRSRPAHFEKTLRATAQDGRPIICLGQQVPERQNGFMDPNRTMLLSFLRDPQSPFNQILQGQRCHLAGHSLGGYLALALRLLEKKALETAHIGGLFLMNPYIRPPSLREETFWGAWRLQHFEKRIRKIPQLLYGETFADLAFATWQKIRRGDKGYWSSDGPPSYGQIGEMLWTTTRTFKQAVANGVPNMIDAIPTVFFLGKRDFMSDPETNRDIAGMFGAAAKVIDCDAGHTPPQESPEGLKEFLAAFDTLDEMAAFRPPGPSFAPLPAIGNTPSGSAYRPLSAVA